MIPEPTNFFFDTLVARITSLERDNALMQAALDTLKPDWRKAQGTSGTLTPKEEGRKIYGYVTPKGDYANVRSAPRIGDNLQYTMLKGDIQPVYDRYTDPPDDFHVWSQLGDGNWVREDVVTFSKERPAPVIAPITWGRWDAPTLYRTITNTFSPSHRGIDYVASEGMTVFCGPMGGTVVKVGRCRACGDEGVSSLSKGFALNDSRVWGNPEWEGGFGHNVVMEYAYADLPNDARDFLIGRGWEGYNAYVLYGHLKTIDVEAGQTFTRKTPIGTVGTSGNSSGFHLHVELKFGKDFRHGFAGLERGLSNPTIVFGS
jgi:hypothetical protein